MLRKLWRDLRATPGRAWTLALTLAVGLCGFYATVGAYSILTRELSRGYVETAPASATLELDRVERSLLERVRAREEIAAAVRRRTLHARFRRPDGSWKNALVFVVEDWGRMAVAKVRPERGAFPPPLGSVVVERSALDILGHELGGRFQLRLPGRDPATVTAAGVVFEPALAPARTHESLYAYATPETASLLGPGTHFDELRVLVRDRPGDRAAIVATAARLAEWIEAEGLGEVHGIRVPPPQRHPHQAQLTTVLWLLGLFSFLVMVLTSLVVASLLRTMLARQARETGVMRALGATRATLTRGYAAMVLLLSVTAVLIAWFPGELLALAWARAVADLLNFDLADWRVPAVVVLVKMAVGLAIPLVLALPVIRRHTRMSVCQALASHGATRGFATDGWLDRLLRRSGRLGVPLTYALRNAARNRRRFGLSLALLTAAGGIFIAAISVADAWDVWTEQLVGTRHYEVEVVMAGGAPTDGIVRRLRGLDTVAAVETWTRATAAVVEPGGVPIQATYPDDAHGALNVVAPPPGARMVDLEMAAGKGLAELNPGEVILNQLVPGAASTHLGETIHLSIAGFELALTVVGKTNQVGVGATAYVSTADLVRATSSTDRQELLRVQGSTADPNVLVQQLAGELAGAPIVSLDPLAVYQNAMVAHFEVLVGALMVLSLLSGGVGALGLGAAITVGLVERTREIGVLKALGGRSRRVQAAVLGEGLVLGGISALLSPIAGTALALVIGTAVGRMSFQLPLPLALSWSAVLWWDAIALVLAFVATWVAARRSLRMTVREALASV